MRNPAGPEKIASAPHKAHKVGSALSAYAPRAHAQEPMPYTLHRLAAGAYDLMLNGEIVASVVRDISAGGDVRGWRAELLKDTLPFPAPFTKPVHAFRTLEAAVAWLGGAEIADDS